ncbi:MAG: hypothetical protein PHE78_06465 [Candidatus Gastranaerophilales bacterium]|nr:hypothetical protein [Candidatus Gastranaerophilales bacterium]
MDKNLMLPIGNNYKKTVYKNPNNFGAKIQNESSKIEDRHEKNSKLAYIALSTALVGFSAFEIAEGVKKHKTFKNYWKKSSFSDKNEMVIGAAGFVLLASMAPDFFKKKEKPASEKNTTPLAVKIGAASLAVLIPSIAIYLLGMFVNFDGRIKKFKKH